MQPPYRAAAAAPLETTLRLHSKAQTGGLGIYVSPDHTTEVVSYLEYGDADPMGTLSPLKTPKGVIRIRAERRLGEMLTQQKAGPGLNPGSRYGGSSKEPPAPTLADAGIAPKTAPSRRKSCFRGLERV